MFEDDSIISELEDDIYDSSSCHPTSGDESSTGDDCMNNDAVAKRGKRRYRDESKWKRNERKRLRNSGKAYHNVSKKLIPEKQFNENMHCTCKVECSTLIDVEQRRKLFKSFYSLGNFDMQTSYICSLIKVSPKQRTYTKNDSNKRNYTRIYYLPNQNGIEIKVCKTLFKATFAISDGRLTRALSGKPHGSTPPTDRRGKQPCQFKTSEEKINQIKQFISKFPTYSSHYSRNKNPSRKYLPPNLNLSKLYSLYREECPNPVRPFIFKKIFNRDFNLSFHSPLSDTCKKCDAFDIKLKSAGADDDIASIEMEKQLHLRKAESARAGMKADAEAGKTDPDLTVIAFDLMKTLPTPLLSVGTAYYKRQLWTYCLGVHNLSTNDAHMFVWDETIASRGPAEIGSCIMHYIKNHVSTSKLIMYSDQCGGQNRNIKMVAICTYITESAQFCVNEIHHKFLVSGHSYLPCDQDFGIIEKQKRFFNEIFVPSDWVKVICQARKKNPFSVEVMKQQMMKSTKKILDNVTNRKVNAEKSKVEWLKIQWIHISREHPYVMFYKYSNNDDVPFSSVNLSKRKRNEVGDLQPLYPNGRPIDIAKYNDLQSLLPYVPPVHHQFYSSIKTSTAVEDTGLVDDDSDSSEH